MGDDYELGCPDCAAWDEAALTFCKGFPTKALEGRTLGELVRVSAAFLQAEKDFIGASYRSDDPEAFGKAASVAAEAERELAALLSHFKDPSDDD